MGLADVISAEDRVEVKFSDFYKLVRAEAQKDLLRNAIYAGVPREQVLKMLTGQNDELEEYRKTELTPEQIREMDRLYAEKCKDLAIMKVEKDLMEKQLEEANGQMDAVPQVCRVETTVEVSIDVKKDNEDESTATQTDIGNDKANVKSEMG